MHGYRIARPQDQHVLNFNVDYGLPKRVYTDAGLPAYLRSVLPHPFQQPVQILINISQSNLVKNNMLQFKISLTVSEMEHLSTSF